MQLKITSIEDLSDEQLRKLKTQLFFDKNKKGKAVNIQKTKLREKLSITIKKFQQ